MKKSGKKSEEIKKEKAKEGVSEYRFYDYRAKTMRRKKKFKNMRDEGTQKRTFPS